MSTPLTEYTTFHKLLDYLQYYQEQSPMLNTFGYGNLVDFGKNISGNSVNYPFLFVVPQAIEYQDNMTVYSCSMIFADILNYDLTNEKDCVSDMSLEARRFLSYVKRGMNTLPEIYDNIDVELPVNALPFFERFGDHVAGVALEVPLIVYDTIDACDYYPSPTPTPTVTSTPGFITPTPTNTTTQTQTPTQTPTNTTTPTQTPTMTPTPSSTPTAATCDLYYFSGSTTVQYSPCSGGTVNELITGGQYRELLSGTLSYTGGTPQYISPAPSVTYIDALETAGYTATTQEQQYITEFFGGIYRIQPGIDQGYGAIQYMYPMIGGTSSTCQINAINPGTDDLTFYGSPTFDISGITWNTSSDYALIGTGRTQSEIGSQNNTHSAIYNQFRSSNYFTQFGTRTFTFPGDSRYFSRGISAAGFMNFAVNSQAVVNFGGGSTDKGPYIVFRKNSTTVEFQTDTAFDGSFSQTSTAPTNIYFGVGCSFTDGLVQFESDFGSKISFFSAGYHLNDDFEYATYISELQTKLGRQAN